MVWARRKKKQILYEFRKARIWKKNIVKLKTNENQYLEELNKILFEMENFYKTLYSSQISDDSFDASASPFANCSNIKRLDGKQQKTCEGLISEEECS